MGGLARNAVPHFTHFFAAPTGESACEVRRVMFPSILQRSKITHDSSFNIGRSLSNAYEDFTTSKQDIRSFEHHFVACKNRFSRKIDSFKRLLSTVRFLIIHYVQKKGLVISSNSTVGRRPR